MELDEADQFPLGYEPNLGSAQAPMLLRIRSMVLQELTMPVDVVQQLHAWVQHTQQSQEDSVALLQELPRRTDVLGQTVQQVPLALCNQVTARASEARDSQASVLQSFEARLAKLEAENGSLSRSLQQLQPVQNALQELASEVQIIKQSLQALWEEALASDAARGLGEVQTMLNHHAQQLATLTESMSTVASEVTHVSANHATVTPRRRPEFFEMTPEVLSCSRAAEVA